MRIPKMQGNISAVKDFSTIHGNLLKCT
jgi:hypothetical protein